MGTDPGPRVIIKTHEIVLIIIDDSVLGSVNNLLHCSSKILSGRSTLEIFRRKARYFDLEVCALLPIAH